MSTLLSAARTRGDLPWERLGLADQLPGLKPRTLALAASPPAPAPACCARPPNTLPSLPCPLEFGSSPSSLRPSPVGGAPGGGGGAAGAASATSTGAAGSSGSVTPIVLDGTATAAAIVFMKAVVRFLLETLR